MKILLVFVSLSILSVTLKSQEINLEDELILYLPFNGNAVDESGQDVPTQVFGPVLTEDQFGNPNSAYLFDGIDDYINLNNNSPLITSNTFTICVWAKINGKSLSTNELNSLFEQRDDDVDYITAKSIIHFCAERFDQCLVFVRTSMGSAERINVTCNYTFDSAWHHYVARLDEQSNLEIYLDGKLFCYGVFPHVGDLTTDIDHVNIGSHHYSGENLGAFNGVMDEIFIYNRALNMCEIEALYSGQLLQER